MKRIKKLVSIVLVLTMVLSISVAAFADGTAKTGSITIKNATIGEAYHIYKLFDVTYGEEENGTVPTAYVATKVQKEALETADGNVFRFTELPGKTIYQVTVGAKADGTEYTADEVIAFIKTFVRTLSGGVTACDFPGAEEVVGNENVGVDAENVATASNITWNQVPAGYYFVTSSLGSTVTIDTSNPNVVITDKNADDPNWNNEPDEPEPDGPVKDVLNDKEQSIDGDEVKVDDILTYSISYTNQSDVILDSLVIKDAPPKGTEYVPDTAKAYYREANDLVESDAVVSVADDKTITWTFSNVPVGAIVEVRFNVKVTEAALTIEKKTVVNDADVTVKIGPNDYDMKTNVVKNPVDDPDDPVKDVLNEKHESINMHQVAVGQKLTYKISYTNNSDSKLDSVEIKDAPPTGTVYVNGSAKGERNGAADDSAKIAVNTDGTITWTFANVEIGDKIDVYFDVTVTEAALKITNRTIVNGADVDVTMGENQYELKTNKVENPVPDEPDEPYDPNPGKVIINPDGSETTTSTGKFGDTVTFDIGVNAVNKVKDSNKIVQVQEYYIYDKLDKGFTLLDPANSENMFVTISGQKYFLAADETQAKAENVTTYNIVAEDGTVIGTLFTQETAGGDTLIGATVKWAEKNTVSGKETITAFYPDCKLHLTYKAVINTEAVIAEGGNLNRVYYDYSTVVDTDPKKPNPEEPKYPEDKDLNHASEEKSTVTYTYALGIQKISEETGEPLEGAEFTAVDAGGNPIYAAATDQAGIYNYAAGAEGAVDTFTTNAEGQIIIKGVNIGTYTFTETKAPKSYIKLKDPVSVEAKMDSKEETFNSTQWEVQRSFEAITQEEFDVYTEDVVYTKAEVDGKSVFTATAKPAAWSDNLYKLIGTSESSSETSIVGTTQITFPVSVTMIEVENMPGSLLPSTGGIGTTIFYILGAILVIGAGVLLVARRRMSTEK